MKLIIRNIKNKGRGVVTLQNIKKGALIEAAPVIVIKNKDWKYIKKTNIKDWNYYWKDNGDFAIILGFGSLYNHSFEPNAYYKPNFKKKTMNYYALKDIKKHKEIVINYNGEPNNQDPVWFKLK